MHVERKWHILLTIFFLLITSGQYMDSKEVKQKERRTLLDLILHVIRDSQQREKPVSRRCGGAPHSAQDMKFSSREKPFYVPRLDNSRLIDIAAREAHLKEKFIQHFGGHVKFSPECKTHFHRLYHNTRDCSTPTYYKRCARLLTRLALSPLCMQS